MRSTYFGRISFRPQPPELTRISLDEECVKAGLNGFDFEGKIPHKKPLPVNDQYAFIIVGVTEKKDPLTGLRRGTLSKAVKYRGTNVSSAESKRQIQRLLLEKARRFAGLALPPTYFERNRNIYLASAPLPTGVGEKVVVIFYSLDDMDRIGEVKKLAKRAPVIWEAFLAEQANKRTSDRT